MFKEILTLLSNKEVINQEVGKTEMINVVNSMFLCTSLYDKLKVKCHPDRFIDENQKEHAEILFQELQKFKYNYDKLLELELQINNFYEKYSKSKSI